MAIQPVGQITVSMGNRNPIPFPTVNLLSGNAYLFILEAIPPAQKLEFGYFVILPFITLGGLGYEIISRQKWYPKGFRFVFPVPAFAAGGASLDIGIALLPIEIYPGRANPQSMNIALSYEDSLLQPLAFGV